jgi:ubiquinol-cytochrome c reductase cytochrome b subunit
MTRRLVLWLDDRLGIAPFARHALRKAFPDHWTFMLGEVALYCFVLLVATGTFLTFFFTASGQDVVYHGPYAPLDGVRMSAAYASVLRLSFEVRAGIVMRQIHHWAADVFVAAIVVHLLRIFFTGAFRRPREINWIIGATLLVLAMGEGFTGYSLPDDLLSGTGIRIAYSVALSIPVIGAWLASLFFGGPVPTPFVIGRLLSMHIMILPGLLIAGIALHLGILWRQKHSQFRGPGRTERNVVGSPLFPNYAMKSVGLALVVFAALAFLGGLFQINPLWLYGPYEPTTASAPAQPDWYVGWLEGLLRLSPSWDLHIFHRTIPSPFWPGVLFPTIFFVLLYAWPFIEQWATGDVAFHQLDDRPRDAPVRTGIGMGILTFAVLMTVAGSNDVLANFFQIPVEQITNDLRVLIPVLPILIGLATTALCRELNARERRGDAHDVWVELRRNSAGGFEVAQPHGGASEAGGTAVTGEGGAPRQRSGER